MYSVLSTAGLLVLLLNGALTAFVLIKAVDFLGEATKALKDFNEGVANAKKMRMFG